MTGAVHGGALWQPNIRASSDYDSIVAADVNDAWYPPAPRVLEAIAEWTPRIHHSPDTSGLALSEAIARHYSIPCEAIRLGAGSSDLLHHIISSCLNAGDEVMTLDPTYAEYARVAGLCGAVVSRQISSSTRMMVLCNPNNPTGSVLSRAEILRMIEDAPASCFVLVDEAYIDFAPEESMLRDAAEIENLAVVRTFSKAYAMAGLRVGYAALGERIRTRSDQRGRPPWPVGLLGLRAAEVALKESCYVRQRVIETIALKNSLVTQLGVPVLPSVTHYFLIDLQTARLGAKELLGRLAEQGIFLRNLCGFTHRDLDRFVRITTQNAAGNTRIALALNQALES